MRAIGRLKMAIYLIQDGQRGRRRAVAEGIAAGLSLREMARLVGDDPTTGDPLVSAATLARDAKDAPTATPHLRVVEDDQ